MSEQRSEYKAEEAKPQRRRRPVRAAVRLMWRLLAAVGAVLLLYLLVFPVLVRHEVGSTLASLGYPGASFVLRGSSPWGVELADVRPAGSGAVAIQNAFITFSPLQVVRGRLRTIRLVGVEVPLEIRNGQVKFGLAPASSSGGQDASAPAQARPLPFADLEIAASTLVVDWENRQIRLPVQGRVQPLGTTARVELTSFFHGATIPVSGTIDTSGRAFDITAGGRNLPASGFRAAIPWVLLNTPLQASGLLDFDLTYRLSGGAATAQVRLRPRNLWVTVLQGGHRMEIRQATGSLALDLLPGGTIGNVSADLSAGQLAFDGYTAQQLKVSAASAGDAVKFDLAVASDAWRVERLKGQLTGLAAGDTAMRVDADFAVSAHGPGPLRQALEASGVHLDDQVAATVQGKASLALPHGGKWRLELPEAHVSLAHGDLAFRGVKVGGATAAIAARGEATPDGTTVLLLPGSRIAAAQVSSDWLQAQGDGDGHDVLALELAEEPAKLDYKSRVELHVPHAQLTLSAPAVAYPAAGTNVAGLAGVLHVSGDVTPQQTKVTMLAAQPSTLSFDSLQRGTTHVSATRLAVLPAVSSGELLRTEPGQGFVAGLKLTGEKVTADVSGGTALVHDLELNANLVHGTLAGEVRFDKGEVAEKTFSLGDVSARMPFAFTGATPTTLPATAPAPAGEFRIGVVAVKDHKLPAVTGQVELKDKQLSVAALTELAKDAVLTAAGTAEMTPAGIKARATAKMPTFALADAEALGRLWPPAAGIGLTGTFSLDGEVTVDGPLVQPRITATAKDARLTSKAYDLAIDGINGAVTVVDFAPLATPGQQRIRVATLHLGKLDMSNGGVEFQLERTGTILVERTRWTWAGGQVYTYAVRLDPEKPEAINAVVYADKLDLKQLMGVIAQGRASGEGLLYGRLPVRMHWPDVSFGEGFLYATGDGGIQVGQEADTVAQLLDQSDPRFAQDPTLKQVKGRIIDALKDFRYDTLHVDFRQTGQGLTASITINGKGRVGEKPQELSLTLNINGFDQLLRNALVVKKIIGSMGQ